MHTMPVITVDGREIPLEDIQTLDGFRTWAATIEGSLRASWIDGEVFIEMSPQDYLSHAPLVKEVGFVLEGLNRELDLGEYYGPPSWITDVASGISTDPDGFLIRWSALTEGRVRVHPERSVELLGVPDMVFEAVSESSKRKDRVHLRERYACAGVQEYWLADALAHPHEFQILVLVAGAYRPQRADPDGWVTSPTWRRSFRLTRGTNRAGLPAFRLEVRADDASP
jgi:Uma2 family endonuclease